MTIPRPLTAGYLAAGLILAAVALSPAPPERPRSARDIAEARANLARKIYAATEEKLKAPPAGDPRAQTVQTIRELADWSRHVMEAERDLARTKAGRVAALQAHADRLKKWADVLKDLAGEAVPAEEADKLEYQRLEAEYALAELQEDAPGN